MPDDSIDKPILPGFEVETMAQSNELMERRKRTKNLLQESIDLSGEAVVSDGSSFDDLLRESNLSPKHLRFCLGFLVILILIPILGFASYKLFGFIKDKLDFEQVIEPEPEPEPETDPISAPSVSDLGTLESGFLLGEELFDEDASFETGDALGANFVSESELVVLIRDFALLYNAMEINVPDLLDRAVDRREALDVYTSELQSLLYLGKQNIEILGDDIERLEFQFTAIQDEKDIEEENFFLHLANLNSEASVASLDKFIVHGRDVVELRAEFLARQKLISFYTLLIADIDRRILDLELNEEALVKGIVVVDISGSNIDLIIEEDSL